MKICVSEKIIEKLGEYGGRTLGRVVGEEMLREVGTDDEISVIELNRKLSHFAETLGLEEVSFGMEEGKGRLRIICGESCASLLFFVRGIAEKLLSELFKVAPESERVIKEEVVFLFGREGGIDKLTRRKLEFLRKLWNIAGKARGDKKPFPGEHLLSPSFSTESSLADYRRFVGG